MVTPSLSWRDKLRVIGLLVLSLGVVYYSPSLTGPLGTYRSLFVVVLLVMQAGITIGLIVKPYTRFVGENVRLTDEPERTDYARRCREWETPLQGVWTVDDLRNNYEFAEIYGLVPGNRHLFVETTFFDVYSPEERTAVVAAAAALADSYYELFAKTLIYLVFLAYYAVVLVVVYATGNPAPFQSWSFVPILVLAVTLVLGILFARRLVYGADRFAAEQTDEETVVAALRKFADEKGESEAESTRIRLLSLLWTRPSPSKRIDRLRERSE